MRKYKDLPIGTLLEVNTASGYVPCKVVGRGNLVERTDVPETFEWHRFYLGDRGYRLQSP